MTRTELFTSEMLGISGADSSRFLHQAALSLLDRDGVVVFLCGDNLFDPDLITKMARKRGADTLSVLSRIRIARLFTMHQLATSAESRLKKLVLRENVRGVMVSGLVPLFSEKRIPEREVETLLERTLCSLRHLAHSCSMPVLLSLPEDSHLSGRCQKIWERAAMACTRLVRLPGPAER